MLTTTRADTLRSKRLKQVHTSREVTTRSSSRTLNVSNTWLRSYTKRRDRLCRAALPNDESRPLPHAWSAVKFNHPLSSLPNQQTEGTTSGQYFQNLSLYKTKV